MTTVSTQERPSTTAARDGFGQSLHAEWTKFRTVRGWVIGMVVAVMVTVLVGLLGPASTTISCHGPHRESCLGRVPLTGPGGEPVSDGFSFVHQTLAGDGDITVRLTGLTSPPEDGEGVQPWTKAGVIIKESTRPGSAYAAVMMTGEHGVRMQSNFTEDVAGRPGGVSGTSPRWLRLTRTGDTITGYESADGLQWSRIGTTTLGGLPASVQVGLFVTSPEYTETTHSFGGSSSSGGSTSATGTFDQVSVHGAAAGPWAGDHVGGDDPGPGAEGRQSDVRQNGDSFAVTGSGDIAPLVTGDAALSRTIENGLVGGVVGLIAVIVVASMFMTGEYRRGLIRTTLAANPRRGRVLAAKSVVVGAVAFVTGLVAAVLAIVLVAQVERSKGLYVFPVPAWTELRIVVGFAAVFAAIAVLALAAGTILRRGAGAVTVVIVAIVLPYIMAIASVLPSSVAEWLLRVTPAAGFSMVQSTTQYEQVIADYTPANGYYPLSPWGGLAVLCGYTVAAAALAGFLLRRRDA
jgi:ABC-type transport system involved in multi-copper enzyme maturation permease subunit